MKTLTENESPTFSSSGDARLDFLFHVIEGSSLERTTELLTKSWAASPLDTMKLIMNVRDIRKGKGIRAQFLLCLKWLAEHQLDSLLANLKLFAEYGCWKDYLNLLLIVLFGELTYDCDTSTKKERLLVSMYDRVILRTVPVEARRELSKTKTTIHQIKRRLVSSVLDTESEKYTKIVSNSSVKATDGQTVLKRSDLDSYFPEKAKGDKAIYKLKTGREKLKLMNGHRRQFFASAYQENVTFRRLYDAIVGLFATQLAEDYANLAAGKSLSLAAKWLPSPGRLFDKYLFMVVPIARQFFALEGTLLTDPQAKDHHLEGLFRQQVYSRLRGKMALPEVAMSAQKWTELAYFNVPSVAMLHYKAAFVRNDFARFSAFVEGKPVKGGALTPGELVMETIRLSFAEGSLYGKLIDDLPKEKQLEVMVTEKQWQSLIEDIKSKGSLLIKDCLAICDVSGSMLSSEQKVKPMYGSIGLTLMLLQLSSGPWSNYCLTFSESPLLSKVDLGASLGAQIKKILELDFGYSTNLNKAFALILSHAKEHSIAQVDMPKVLFIFTDMEFDAALPEKTNFESAQVQYREAGYEMPLVVFWNLKGDKSSRSTPVKCSQEGVFLLSGYSAQTLNFFFTCTDLSEMTPLTMLNQILEDARYEAVTVAPSATATLPMMVDEEAPGPQIAISQ